MINAPIKTIAVRYLMLTDINRFVEYTYAIICTQQPDREHIGKQK